MKKYALITLIICIAGYIGINFVSGSQTLLDKTIEFNNQQYDSCFWLSKKIGWSIEGQSASWLHSPRTDAEKTMTDSTRYQQATACWQSHRKLTPDDLFLTVPRSLVDSGKCSISQSEDDHVNKVSGGMYATDLACNFEGQGVYAPDYLDQMIEYKIESIWSDNLLWNFVILSFPDWGTMDDIRTRWYFWHTVLDSKMKVWDTVSTWVQFAKADLSGVTTGWHTHIELRRMYDGVWQSVRYVTRAKERKLDQMRMGGSIPKANAAEESGTRWNTSQDVVYYFTAYNLGDPAQNDGQPCVWASGKDLCKMETSWIRTMALTIDIRKKMWIKFWDKVALTWEIGCEWLYQIEDEMNKRFRENCIIRPGTQYCIKGDIPSKKWGACTIKKL